VPAILVLVDVADAVVDRSTSGDGAGRSGVRSRFDATMARLRDVPGPIRIDAESTGSQDVTQEFRDVEPQIRIHDATEVSLLRPFERPTRIDDVFTVQRQLTAVRAEIETLGGRLKYFTAMTDFSSIAISMSPKTAPPPRGELDSRPPLVAAATEAWQASRGLVEGVAAGIVRVVVFL